MPSFSDLTPAAASRLLEGWPVALRGRVTELGAATSGVPASEDTAVVSVEEILAAPATFPNVTGGEVTVRLKQAARRGEHAVFLVRSWLYSVTVGVEEGDRVGGLRSTDAVRALFDQATRQKEEDMLRARLSGSDLVVAGAVVETHPLPEERQIKVDTEHAPDWWEAIVDVEETLKGKTERRLTVLFPKSTDEIWIDSPKPERGLRAIFLLRRDQQERGGPGLWVKGLTALEPIDVQPIEEIERVRSLIGKKG